MQTIRILKFDCPDSVPCVPIRSSSRAGVQLTHLYEGQLLHALSPHAQRAEGRARRGARGRRRRGRRVRRQPQHLAQVADVHLRRGHAEHVAQLRTQHHIQRLRRLRKLSMGCRCVIKYITSKYVFDRMYLRVTTEISSRSPSSRPWVCGRKTNHGRTVYFWFHLANRAKLNGRFTA